MIEAERSTILTSSKRYGIPYATLHRHMKSGSSEKKLGRFKKVFSDEEEAELLKFLQKLDDVFYGMTRLEFLQLAGEFAKRKGKTGRFTEGVAGKGWYKNFMLKNPTVTLRTPEPTSLARVKGFNRVAVGRFYDLLEEKYFEIEVNVFQKAHPGRIINQFIINQLVDFVPVAYIHTTDML
nr:unnamed protein product [Callosobruchus chinensis]